MLENKALSGQHAFVKSYTRYYLHEALTDLSILFLPP